MLTLPESDAARATVMVCVPAARFRVAVAICQVSQLPVGGSVSVVAGPPSAETLRVRVVFCPSPPVLLA